MKRFCALLALLFALLLLCGCVAHKLDLQLEGICIVADNGRVLLMVKDGPIVLSDRSKEGNLLDGLQTGDRIRVLHDGIAESFPAQAGVYRVEYLGKGDVGELSPQMLDTLRELGWIF